MTSKTKKPAHAARMISRRKRQLERTEGHTFMHRGSEVGFPSPIKPIVANLSRHHPDAGQTPREHMASKAYRAARIARGVA